MRPAINPLEPLRSAWRHRDLLVQMINREARARYRGSAGGVLWVAIHPLLMLVVYTFFFTEVFPTRWSASAGSHGEFALMIFIGLLLHGFLSEAVGRAPSLVVSNPNLVKKVVFPLDLLPVVGTATALFHFGVGFLIWLVFHIWQQGLPPATAWWLPVIIVPLALHALGLAWMLASLGVYLRDISQIVPVVMSILLFASPIFYPLSTLREPLRSIVLASPLTIPVEQARAVLFDARPPDAESLLLYTIAAIVVAYVGFVWFQGTRKGFADVL